MEDINIIEIDSKNISKYQPRCFTKENDTGYLLKEKWLKKRFSEGLKIYQIYTKKDNKLIGFIEYTTIENAYRAVSGKKYLFVNCIWISPNKFKNKGYASLLINQTIEDAKKAKLNGVAVIASEGAFMASKSLFKKNNFKTIETSKPSFSLMVNEIKKGALPKINDWESELAKIKDLQILYTYQCPWVAKSIADFESVLKKKKIKYKIKELKTPRQAQKAPSVYSSFNLILNGKLLADHYISARRFENILTKELK